MALFLRKSKQLYKQIGQHMGQAGTLDKTPTVSLEQQILQAIKDVRYGSVEIIIHDSHVVQIERKEKIRVVHTRKENIE